MCVTAVCTACCGKIPNCVVLLHVPGLCLKVSANKTTLPSIWMICVLRWVFSGFLFQSGSRCSSRHKKWDIFILLGIMMWSYCYTHRSTTSTVCVILVGIALCRDDGHNNNVWHALFPEKASRHHSPYHEKSRCNKTEQVASSSNSFLLV